MREFFVSPFQGDEACGTKILGLRAARFIPGFNIPGFQPFLHCDQPRGQPFGQSCDPFGSDMTEACIPGTNQH